MVPASQTGTATSRARLASPFTALDACASVN
jgi:hypothetical protein